MFNSILKMFKGTVNAYDLSGKDFKAKYSDTKNAVMLDVRTKAEYNSGNLKGAKNVEILKQGLHSPMSVEKQIAIIYAGTKGLLKEVPVSKVKSFESEYITQLETRFPNVLAELKAGKLTDEVEKTLVEVSKEVSLLYK